MAGRYTVELVGRGARGPEVVALFVVDVGGGAPPREEPREALVEPTTVEEARTAVLARINALRLAHKLPQLYPDPGLTRVAQAYSERMAREGFFAHVAPDGSDLRGRLSAAGIRYRTSGENLGLASGPLAAHQGIELSPGHRGNLLGAQFTLAGLGVDTFVEFGPGTVLTGLVKRILPDARTVNVGTAEQIEQFQMENA